MSTLGHSSAKNRVCIFYMPKFGLIIAGVAQSVEVKNYLLTLIELSLTFITACGSYYRDNLKVAGSR